MLNLLLEASLLRARERGPFNQVRGWCLPGNFPRARLASERLGRISEGCGSRIWISISNVMDRSWGRGRSLRPFLRACFQEARVFRPFPNLAPLYRVSYRITATDAPTVPAYPPRSTTTFHRPR